MSRDAPRCDRISCGYLPYDRPLCGLPTCSKISPDRSPRDALLRNYTYSDSGSFRRPVSDRYVSRGRSPYNRVSFDTSPYDRVLRDRSPYNITSRDYLAYSVASRDRAHTERISPGGSSFERALRAPYPRSDRKHVEFNESSTYSSSKTACFDVLKKQH